MNELTRIIDQVSRDKGIDREILIMTLEEAIRSAAKKKYGPRHELEVTYNEELGEIEVFEFKEVVEKVEDEPLEISLREAKKLDPDCELGDELGVKMDTSTFGRIAAQSAKQVIIQRIKDAERDIVYEDFKDRKGEIINGIVTRYEKGSLVVNLGRTDGVLPPREQIPRESYRTGDRVRAYVLDVKRISRGPQIILSRTHPEFLKTLFELEVPEMNEGVVSIVTVAREPGGRSKIAVASRESDIDPVGACVGVKGSRVQSVVQELRGEKIDIIPWNPDPAKFVCSALAPAEVARVIIDEEERSMEVIVPDEHLSLAIGRRGQNVRLASKLSQWRIDVKSEEVYSRELRDGYRSLLEISGPGELLADVLFSAGYSSAEMISQSTAEELSQLEGVDEEDAAALIEQAQEFIAGGGMEALAEASEEEEAEDEETVAEATPEAAQSEDEAAPEATQSEDEAAPEAAQSEDEAAPEATQSEDEAAPEATQSEDEAAPPEDQAEPKDEQPAESDAEDDAEKDVSPDSPENAETEAEGKRKPGSKGDEPADVARDNE